MSGPAKASPGGMSGPVWTCLGLSGPVQEDKYLLQTNGNPFFFLQELHLSCLKKIMWFLSKMEANPYRKPAEIFVYKKTRLPFLSNRFKIVCKKSGDCEI